MGNSESGNKKQVFQIKQQHQYSLKEEGAKNKFAGDLEFGNTASKNSINYVIVIDISKEKLKIYYQHSWTFKQIMDQYWKTTHCIPDSGKKICLRKGKNSKFMIDLQESIHDYLKDEIGLGPLTFNIGYQDISEVLMKKQNSRVHKYPKPKPMKETFPIKFKDLKIKISFNRSESITINYKNYFYYEINQVLEEKIPDSRDSFCLKIKNKILTPKEKLKQIQKLQMDQSNLIEALLVKSYDKILFNSMMNETEFRKNNFQLTLDDQDNLRKRKLEVIKENQNFQLKRGIIKGIQQLCEPLQFYTCNYFFNDLNSTLRTLKMCQGQNLKNREYLNLSSCLIHCLRQFDNYIGQVHRGMNRFKFSQYFQKDQVLCWTSFTSTTKQLSTAKSFVNNFGSLIHIQSLSGKDISKFSVYPHEQEVLFSPFSYFIVQNIKKLKQYDEVWLVELPSPQIFSKKIILWVDDQPKNNTQFINQFIDKDVQVMQVTSTKMAEAWMKQFGWLLDWNETKIRVISDMVRKQDNKDNYYAGIDLLQSFFKKHKIDTPILIFCNDEAKAKGNIKLREIEEGRIYKVTNEVQKLKEYSEFKCIKMSQMAQN